jgi:3-deoxy-D-manno-octulosonic-acid transferase
MFLPKYLGLVLSPLVRLFIVCWASLGKADKSWIRARIGLASTARPSGAIVWIHAASFGEASSVLPIVEMLQQDCRQIHVLMTTATVTSRDMIQERLAGQVIHQFMPFDIFSWTKRFIDYWNPVCSFFVESEIWPNTLHCLNEKKIPVYLLNAKLSLRSINRWKLVKNIFNYTPFASFKEIFTPCKDLMKKFNDLGAKNVSITPNLKMIAEKIPVDQQVSAKFAQKIKNRPLWMAVSTHSAFNGLTEEEFVMDIHQELRQTLSNILTIIAPRHVKRTPEIISMCKKRNLSYEIYSRHFQQDQPITAEIFIIDVMGMLGSFFDNIKAVFVGGSLVKGIGGHNIIEPIHFGCDVYTGPFVDKFQDLRQQLRESWTIVSSKEDLYLQIIQSLKISKKTKANVPSDYKSDWQKNINKILEGIDL